MVDIEEKTPTIVVTALTEGAAITVRTRASAATNLDFTLQLWSSQQLEVGIEPPLAMRITLLPSFSC